VRRLFSKKDAERCAAGAKTTSFAQESPDDGNSESHAFRWSYTCAVKEKMRFILQKERGNYILPKEKLVMKRKEKENSWLAKSRGSNGTD
jgi:hypothetical protein